MPNGPNNGTNPSTSNGTIPQVGQSSVTQMILPGSCIGVFDEASCDWATFYERVELYFEANSIPDNKKVSFLLAVIPLKTYQLLKTLCQPIAVKDKELDEINELLSNHLNPKPKILAQRCRFHKCQQLPGQPISDLLLILKKIAEDCKFDNKLDSRLRDQFVCGLNIQSIVNRLLSEPDNRTFKNAVQIALSIELTTKESAEFQNKNSSVNLLKTKIVCLRVNLLIRTLISIRVKSLASIQIRHLKVKASLADFAFVAVILLILQMSAGIRTLRVACVGRRVTLIKFVKGAKLTKVKVVRTTLMWRTLLICVRWKSLIRTRFDPLNLTGMLIL